MIIWASSKKIEPKKVKVMPLLKKRLTDEEQIAKWDEEDKLMLKKNYDIRDGQSSLPPKAGLLEPKKIFATSYEKINENLIRINTCYERNFWRYVTPSVRMNYTEFIKGSLLCENIKSVKELRYSKKSSISVSRFSDYKTIVFPVQNSMTVKVKCKKIFIEQIDIYAMYDGQLILNEDYIKILEQLLQNE